MDWQVSRGRRACAACEKTFEPQEAYHSTLMEKGDLFLRGDYCEACWPSQEPEAFFSFWKTQLPSSDAPRKLLVDTDVIYDFFIRLKDKPDRLMFRYLLALLLTRKRYLRLDTIEQVNGHEELVFWDRRERAAVRVVTPQASPDQIEAAKEQLSGIFDMSFDDADGGSASAAGAASGTPPSAPAEEETGDASTNPDAADDDSDDDDSDDDDSDDDDSDDDDSDDDDSDDDDSYGEDDDNEDDELDDDDDDDDEELYADDEDDEILDDEEKDA